MEDGDRASSWVGRSDLIGKSIRSLGRIALRSRICMYLIYTPNLGLLIAVLDQEREQCRFKWSTEGARGSTKEARESTEETPGRARGSKRAQHKGA